MRRVALLALLASLPGPAAAQQTNVIPQPTPVAPDSPLATPAGTLVDDIIRLWKANLSEGFIDKYVQHAAVDRDLTADDVVRLRSAGVPESLIASVTLRRPAPAEHTAPPAHPEAPPLGGSRRWDGLVRRNSGVVLLKSRWDPGVLEFKDGFLRWTDARDVKKNVLVPATQLKEQQLTCLKKAGGNECFEWVVKTRNEEYRFREVGWAQGENAKVEELFDSFHGYFPSLISSRQPVDEK